MEDFISSIRRMTTQRGRDNEQDRRYDRNEAAINHLKRLYMQYKAAKRPVSPRTGGNPRTPSPAGSDEDFFKMLPLFCNAFGKSKGPNLVQKFSDCHAFAQDVSLMFVVQVSEMGRTLSKREQGMGLLNFLSGATSGNLKVGWNLLQTINILADTQESIVQALMCHPLFATLVRCVHVFIDLPPPPSHSSSPTHAGHPGTGRIVLATADQRESVCKMFQSIMTKCCRYGDSLKNVLVDGDLGYLFSCCTSAPCLPQNFCWRRLAADVLMSLSRNTMCPEFINFVQRRGTLRLCVHNLTNHIRASSTKPRSSEGYVSPLEVVDLLVPVLCCLQDSCEYPSNLLEEFSKCSGYKFLYDFLIEMDRRERDTEPEKKEEAQNATHQMMNLLFNLCFQGYVDLHPTITEPGPYQAANFQVPIAAGGGQSVKNMDAFQVLEQVFLRCQSTNTAMEVVNTMYKVLTSDPANYFILDSLHSLPHLIEVLPVKSASVQSNVLNLLDYVVIKLNYIPSAELADISLILKDSQHHLQLSILVLETLIKLVTSNTYCKEVFREVGVLSILTTCLKESVSASKQLERGEELSVSVIGAVQFQSSRESVEGEQEQFLFLLAECIRVLIEDNAANANFFREVGGVEAVTELLPFVSTRPLALRLITHLVLSEGGVSEMSLLLNRINTSPSIAIGLKCDLLKTIIHCFNIECTMKDIFRQASGFEYTVSFMSALYGSLAPHRPTDWSLVDRREILEYVKLILSTIASALQENPANTKLFQESIRFESFSEPLRNLGCFADHLKTMADWAPNHSGLGRSFLSFNAEFITHARPSEVLDPNSCVYAAAQVFQYLRNMAVEDDRRSCLEPIIPDEVPVTVDNQYVPPSIDSVPVVVHPGPLVCMVDLLPGVHPSVVNIDVSSVRVLEDEEVEEDSAAASRAAGQKGRGRSGYENVSLKKRPPSTVGKGSSEGNSQVAPSPTPSSNVPPRPPKPTSLKIDSAEMSTELLEMWCIYLQERVATEIYRLSMLTQNQQSLCQAGLPGQLLWRCRVALANEDHPVHEPLQRIFEKLSYQALMCGDLRNFLRLGDPLFSKYNEVVQSDELIKVHNNIPYDPGDLAVPNNTEPKDMTPEYEITMETDTDGQPLVSFGGSLSLARIQSLVSMTTPRGSSGSQISPSFVEFNLSCDGFGCLFLPSVFPQSIQLPSQTGQPVVPGVGLGGDRVFPPQNGLTFSTWIRVVKHSVRTSGTSSSESLSNERMAEIFTLYQSVEGMELKKKKKYSCLVIALSLRDQMLLVSTQQQSLKDARRFKGADDTLEESGTFRRKEKVKEALFDCSCLFDESCWHHLVIVIHRNVMRGATASLYLDGAVVDTKKVTYIQPIVSTSSVGAKDAAVPHIVSVNGIIGTRWSRRHILPIVYHLGPTYLFEETVSSQGIKHIARLGPTYMGCFQAPVIKDYHASTSLVLGNQRRVLNPLVPEEKVVFGVVANVKKCDTISRMATEYCSVDIKDICKETQLKKEDAVTPVNWLPNVAIHLSGPSRTLGAIIIGSSGVRTFTPSPLRALLPSVGGTKVMLGLVAMATTVDCLYASVKALVCAVEGNDMALKDMARTGGFKILGMLLRSKSSLLNSHILHLILSLVGTLDSEHECTEIPYPEAFRDLLADLSVWRETSQEIQRSLLQHFRELLTAGGEQSRNAEMMVSMNMVSTLLHRLQERDVEEKTKKDICDTLAVLFRGCLTQNDLRRLGQYLVNTLPEKVDCDEDQLPVYSTEAVGTTDMLSSTESTQQQQQQQRQQQQRQQHQRQHSQLSRSRSVNTSDTDHMVQSVRLRNMLLDLMLTMISAADSSVDVEAVHKFHKVLGFDWLLLFLQGHIHMETAMRALRLLVHILSDPVMFSKFREGDLAGKWLEGSEQFLLEAGSSDTSTTFYTLMSPKGSHFQSLKAITEMTNDIPGFHLLSFFLPQHSESPQAFLLLIALLLGQPISDVPYGAPFNSDVLMGLFESSKSRVKTLKKKSQKFLNLDAVRVLLCLLRYLLHQDHEPESESEIQALTLTAFIKKLYTSPDIFPEFAEYVHQQEFIEALASTLFPVPRLRTFANQVSKLTESDDMGFVVVEQNEEQQPPALLKADREHHDVYSVIQLLVTILLDALSTSVQQSKNTLPVCPLIDTILEASSSACSRDLQHNYQTVLLSVAMEHIQSGSDSLAERFSGSKGHYSRSLLGLAVLCHKIVDKLWQGSLMMPSNSVYSFMSFVVEQARAQPSLYPLHELQRALNRVILCQLSSRPKLPEEEANVQEALCLVSSHAKTIFDELNNDPEFYACLVFCLLELVLSDERSEEAVLKGYVPTSYTQLRSAANRLWTKLLELKREVLQEVLHVELPAPSAPVMVSHTQEYSMKPSSPKWLKLTNCEALKTEQLTRVWDNFLASERSNDSTYSSQVTRAKSMRQKLVRKVTESKQEKMKNNQLLIEEYALVSCPQLIQAVHSLERWLQKKYTRNCDYSLRFTASEWSHIVGELTRECGLWGPTQPCFLDKWMLDSVEGPSRMRKRMCRNAHFYQHYPFVSRSAIDETLNQKPPRSVDSVYQHCRSQLFKNTLYLSLPVAQVHVTTGLVANLAIDYGMEPSGLDEEAASTSQAPVVAAAEEDLVQDEVDDPVNQAVLRMLEFDEKIAFKCKCAHLEGLDAKEAVLLLGNTHFYAIEGVTLTLDGGFIDIESVSDGDFAPVVPKELRHHMRPSSLHPPIKCIKWNYGAVREIHKRRYVLRECALEVFSDDGRNHFLVFEKETMPKVYQKLEGLIPILQSKQSEDLIGGVKQGANLEKLVQKWESGEISNFQYLMHLNTHAGRSYNDLMQYPIFPWIIADYSSETLDFTEPKTFRDLSRPMGAQSEKRREIFNSKYRDSVWEPTFKKAERFHYRTHYCSAMTVATYLIRMEPYTQHYLHLQDGAFDHPDRAFHTVEGCWTSASFGDPNDIRELVPEFYYLPDFLTNSNRFILGVKQNGTVLGDVVLPPWAKGDPKEFIRVQREALECEYVSSHLHEWVDLIFGYKQSGPAAVEACNVFHPYFYEENVQDIDRMEPADRAAALNIIHNFGQMPKQLFKKPHRPKRVHNVAPPIADFAPSPLARLFYRDIAALEPSKDCTLRVQGEVGQIIADKHLIAMEMDKILIPPNHSKYFAWNYNDQSARLCSLDQDKTLAVFEGLHQGQILCAAAASNSIVITGGESTVVCVWEMRKELQDKGKLSMQLKQVLYGHTNSVVCLATSKTYRVVVSGSADATCILWDLNKMTFIRQLCPHSGPITALAISDLTGDIVSCTQSNIYLWTINGELLVKTAISKAAYSSITCCTMSELLEYDPKNVIVVGCSDGVVREFIQPYIDIIQLASPPNDVCVGVLGGDSQYNDNVKVFTGRVVFSVSYTNNDLERRKKEKQRKLEERREERSRRADKGVSQLMHNTWSMQSAQTKGLSEGSALHPATPTSPTAAKTFSLADSVSHMMGVMEEGLEDEELDTQYVPTRKAAVTSETPPKQMSMIDAIEESPKEDVDGEGDEDKERPGGEVPVGGGSEGSRREGGWETNGEQGASQIQVNLEHWESHKRSKWYRVLVLKGNLTMHTAFERKDNIAPAKVTCLAISKDHRKLFVGDSLGRVYTWLMGDAVGHRDHWQNEDITDKCTACHATFGVMERKHHCRDCGKIFCHKCSSYESEVLEQSIKEKVRVCKSCYEKNQFLKFRQLGFQ